MKSGSDLIAAERQRQINKEGYTPEHDDDHINGELALAAIAYAAPVRVFVHQIWPDERVIKFTDPFPEGWADKRIRRGFELPDPSKYTPKQRIDLLVKAGALIAAEIDRLQRDGEG